MSASASKGAVGSCANRGDCTDREALLASFFSFFRRRCHQRIRSCLQALRVAVGSALAMLEPNTQEWEETEEGLITEDDLGLQQQTSRSDRRQHVCAIVGCCAQRADVTQFIRVGAIIAGILVCMGLLVVIAMVVHHYEKRAYGT